LYRSVAAGASKYREDEAMSQLDDAPDQPPPLNLSELRLRLRYVEPGQYDAQQQIMGEIKDLGAAASPLVPLVAERYRAGALNTVAACSLTDIFLKTKVPELLNALREMGAIQQLDDFRKCSLLEAGVADIERDLLASLWGMWQKAGNPARVEIVKSLGRAGGPSVLEMLEVICYRMAGRLPEEKAKAAGPLDHLVNSADEEFLEHVRTAMRSIKSRGTK
jgi:hypothetical protein